MTATDRIFTRDFGRLTLRVHPEMGTVLATLSTYYTTDKAEQFIGELQHREMFRIDWLKPWEREGPGAVRLGELTRGSAMGRQVRFWS